MSSGLGSAERWELVDQIVSNTVEYREQRDSFTDIMGDLLVDPWFGIPFAVTVLYGAWAFFGAVAGFFTDGYFVPLFDEYWLPWLQSVFPWEGSWVYFILIGDPAAQRAVVSWGMLTSGLFVAIGVVLPAIFALYLVLVILEDSGYMSRLAVLLDTVFEKIGLQGYSVIPMVLSFGCNVPGVAATRNLESKKQRFMMMTLLSVFIPCGAQLGIMLSLIPQYTGYILLYLLIGFFTVGAVLDKLLPGKTPKLITDVPPMRKPTIGNVSTKLWLRMRGFFVSAIPFVLLGVGLINVLWMGGAIDWLSTTLEPLLTGWFGVPKETVPGLVAGFIRKDLAVAQLTGVGLSPFQTVMSVVMISIYFPCAATFAMLIKEGKSSFGIVKTLVGAVAILGVTLFLWGGLLRLIGMIMGVA
ncbi:nucleoside recognition domain-containing protein [Halodesulfurarchaeum sp. HSR-GB]|uniref:nucleoside recognition domain-containing protein n=1 Tax=Halodesulfurarchaeum sp. HSR-GB TaxID=3074077 RepID=UPI0028616762|nr:nucleoside recognition domain-containing protein [Halodesulfurarchaeum sp. HSR-GB]MDR5657722.1 nucleoside recognition domain-containing protein [Halodesulfurarchaeum sp. HSR-GB]